VIARKLCVRGRVQGVGYRDAMVDVARSAGLHGYVRNAPDGSVEAHVQGDDFAVAKLIAWASHGPRLAQVDAVLVEAVEPEHAHIGFRRT